MHEALQFTSQSLQFLHLSASITGRKMAKREKKLSVVPTGHMLLQYSLPVKNASKPTTRRVAAATASTAPALKCATLSTMRP